MGEIEEILKFLETPRTRKEIVDEFDLSNTMSYNRLKWLHKAKLIESYTMSIPKKTARQTFYKRRN